MWSVAEKPRRLSDSGHNSHDGRDDSDARFRRWPGAGPGPGRRGRRRGCGGQAVFLAVDEPHLWLERSSPRLDQLSRDRLPGLQGLSGQEAVRLLQAIERSTPDGRAGEERGSDRLQPVAESAGETTHIQGIYPEIRSEE